MRELHRYGLGKELRHQFRLIAATPKPATPPRTPIATTKGGRWRSYRPPASRPIGLAAAKHQQQMELRAIVRAEVRSAGRFPPPVKPRREPIIENVPMKLRLGRGGPMSFYELVAWHRANGTLAAFMAAHGD